MSGRELGVLGSINLDTVVSVQRFAAPGETALGSHIEHFPGGKGLNQIVAARRNGVGAVIFGAVGDDDAGRHLTNLLDNNRVDTSALRTVTTPTGRAFVFVDETGENSIVVVPGANHEVRVPTAAELEVRVLLAQLEVPIDVVTQAFLNADRAVRIFNPAPAAELPDELVAACDVIIPNEHELELIGGADDVLRRGCPVVVVTRGSQGADVITADGITHIAPYAVDAIDTTGAGDAFCGAFAAQIAQGAPIADAARWGGAAGALATTVRGAMPSQPTASSIAALMKEGDVRHEADLIHPPLMPRPHLGDDFG